MSGEQDDKLVPVPFHSEDVNGKEGLIVYWCPQRAIEWVTRKGGEFTEAHASDTSEHVTWVYPDGATWVSPELRRKGDEPALLRAQVEQWAGRELTDEEFGRVCKALPHSSVPEAIGEIVANF